MNRLPYFSRLNEFRFEELDIYIRQTETGASNELAKFTEWTKSHTDGMSDEEVSEFVDHYSDDWVEVSDTVPQLLRRSHLLLVFGLFESQAAGLCRMLHGDGVTQKRPSKNLHISDIKKYLIEEGAFPQSLFRSEWEYLDQVRGVRNAIAHHGARLRTDKSGKQAKAFISSEKLLSIDGAGTIKIEEGLAELVRTKSSGVMSSIILEAEKKY